MPLLSRIGSESIALALISLIAISSLWALQLRFINPYTEIIYLISFIKLLPISVYFKIEVYTFSLWSEYNHSCF